MKRIVATIGRTAYALYAICVFVLVTTATTLVISITPGLARRRRLARFAARTVFRLAAIPVRVRSDALADQSYCIVVANHASYLDGIILTAVLPPSFSFVVKREMLSVPVAGFLLRKLGTVFVDRFDSVRGARDTRAMLRVASGGQRLAVFPEGTFRRDPGLARFRRGAFLTAARTAHAVLPVTILGSRAILPAGRWLPRRSPLKIVFHDLIRVHTPGRDAAEDLRHAARKAILTRLDEPDLTATDAQRGAVGRPRR